MPRALYFNDSTAVGRLLRDGVTVPRPVLRFWDLVVFWRQAGHLDDAACDHIRQTLSKLQEHTIGCFTGKHFVDGLPFFYPRFVDSHLPLLGAREPQERLDERMYLQRALGSTAG